MKKLLTCTLLLALLPLSANAMKLQLLGSSSKLSYDIVKHLPIVGSVPVHGDLTPASASTLKGLLTTSDAADASGLYFVSGEIDLQKPEFVTDSEIRDQHVRDMIDGNGIVVQVVNVRSSAQIGEQQNATVSLTINGITLPVPLTYSLFIVRQGAKSAVTMRGQMIVDRSKFNMSIHGIAGTGDFLIDKNFVLKLELPFRN